MYNYFISLSTSEKISLLSLIIATISIILSLINFIHLLISKHKKLEIDLITYRIVKLRDFYFHQFQIQIHNKSQLPISIKSISCNHINSPRTPYLIKEETYKNISGNKESIKTMTFSFPINLSSLEGTCGYLEFKSVNRFDINSLDFNVFTNRGKISKIKVCTQSAIKDDEYTPYSV